MSDQERGMTTSNGTQGMQRGGAAPAKDLRAFLESPRVASKLAEVATAALTPNDLVRLALLALSRQPELGECTQDSILRSLIDAAALGIQPGGLMGRGYLVPRNNKKTGKKEACFDPGWRGLIDIARRSGQIQRISAHVVHERDTFEVTYGLLEDVTHRPFLEGDPGPTRAAYAVAVFADGSMQFELISRAELDKVRASSAAGSGGPWAQWYDEMARKTVVRRLCKYLPYSPELEHAVRVATAADANGPELNTPPQAHRLTAAAEEEGPDFVAIIAGARTSVQLGNIANQIGKATLDPEIKRSLADVMKARKAELARPQPMPPTAAVTPHNEETGELEPSGDNPADYDRQPGEEG